MLCDCCLNKSICRVRQMKDEVYPGIEIDISRCQRYEAGISRKTAAPVMPVRSMKELANVAARIQKITKEKTEDSKIEMFICPVCKKEIVGEEGVTDVRSGRTVCQSCYEKL